ncbi:helix-turn-helix transcriptional regulator [Crossiella sp. CA-258035]|uniref:helix-turn-helix domain-containing protein n=1 Tax=Crossiella sp. CA-258035 TaxID=2981138 RepID=UPI0024BD0CC1|nr:helix-turn-helix transcriptional regulator [Crossiella sp. CA-258035]WHT20946.1 helix-turn-helix transcriptional regulator [Crossiella sp. CA-258035]
MAARTTTSNGPAIRAIRELSGLSIKETADLLASAGIPVTADHLSNVELGRKGASPALVRGLADVLKVPYVALVTATPDAA